LSILEAEGLLVVPALEAQERYPRFRLPAPWDKVAVLVEETSGERVRRGANGCFRGVAPGVYRMNANAG
jgi:hypothetical protein